VVAYTGLVSATKATVITISKVTTRRLIRHLPIKTSGNYSWSGNKRILK
jgi:hypothetical protein